MELGNAYDKNARDPTTGGIPQKAERCLLRAKSDYSHTIAAAHNP